MAHARTTATGRRAWSWAPAAAAALAAALVGCAPSRPSIEALRTELLALVREDAERYNQRMDRYTAPRWEIDGSSCSMIRSRRVLAVEPAEIEVRETGGRTTIYEADVPHIIETYIKSGQTEQECRDAPERRLPEQRVTYTYRYDTVTKTWRQARGGGGEERSGIGG